MNANERRRTGPAVLNRVLGYMLHYYKYLFILVIGCILVSAVCTVVGATFPQTLIDEYIEPMLSTGSRDFTGLAQDIKQLVCIMGVGVIASFGYNRIMVNVSQGTLRHLRDDLFHKMESLPIKYFDTHAHGDIMSVYTNDQRRGHPAPAFESEHSPAHQLQLHHGGHPHYHDHHEPRPHRGLGAGRHSDVYRHQELLPPVRQILRQAAAGPGRGGRLH